MRRQPSVAAPRPPVNHVGARKDAYHDDAHAQYELMGGIGAHSELSPWPQSRPLVEADGTSRQEIADTSRWELDGDGNGSRMKR